MRIAIEGCAHGELEKIYDTIQGIEKEQNIKVDLLLCCGDFQSTRNLEDLQTMAVPKKYQNICTFYKYYSGERVAPMLTIFIGGNHEASNYLQELPYGGWVAPNIYYLGYAGVVLVNGVRIAGVSGIYKGHDFLRGHFEFAPYTEATCRSVYHVRQLEVFRLKQLSSKIDIFMSHDWPRGIYNYGNKSQLLRFKPHFQDDIDNERLGSRPCEDLLKTLKPAMWFAAHLHCKFAAVVPHDLNDDSNNDVAQEAKSPEKITKFLALDKCLPKRRFLQLLEIDCLEHTDDSPELEFEYDIEWLTILYLTNHLISVKTANNYMPGPRSGATEERYNFTPTAEELQQVREKLGGDLRIPKNFCRTVPSFVAGASVNKYPPQPKAQINPQSVQFCDALGIDDPLSLAMIINGHELSLSSTLDESSDAPLNDSSISILLAEQSSVNNSLSGDTSNLQSSPGKRKCGFSLSLPKPNANPLQQTSSPTSPKGEEFNSTTNPNELVLADSSEDEQANELSLKCNEKEDIIIPTAPALSEEVASPLNSIPPVKKFKRRNQDMYKMDDATDEA